MANSVIFFAITVIVSILQLRLIRNRDLGL
jgi:ABC-type sugar transport system permease subunit